MTQSKTFNVAVASLTAVAMVVAFMPAFANAQTVRVVNNNTAEVGNWVMTGASTGGNTAVGNAAGNGGRGGDVSGGDADDNTTGRGGNGGSASGATTVNTGNASATAVVTNDVNNNRTNIDRCGCEGQDEEGGDTVVRNTNNAGIGNFVMTHAQTGYNHASGNMAGDARRGGDVRAMGQGEGSGDTDDNTTGNGGNGGNASGNTRVSTGHSSSVSDVLNVVNSNVTRIRR